MDAENHYTPYSNWPIVQAGALGIIALGMLWVVAQAQWSLSVAVWMLLPARSCWSIYREVQRQTKAATTSQERLNVNWQLAEMVFAMLSLLSLCIWILRNSHWT